MQPTAHAPQFPTFPMVMPLIGREQMMLGPSLQMEFWKVAMRCQIEAANFVQSRCEQDLQLAHDLVSSDGFKDAFDLFNTFTQNSLSQYAEEASRFAWLGSQVARGIARTMHRQAREAVDNAAAATVA